LQNIHTTIITRNIKHAKPKSKLGLLKAIAFSKLNNVKQSLFKISLASNFITLCHFETK
jgi:hypothetical protein